MKQRSYSTFSNAEEPQAKWEPTAAPFWSRLWFSYAGPVLQAGNSRQLTFDDLWELEEENQASAAFSAFLEHYERHGQSVIKATLVGYGGQLFLCELASLFETASGLFTPIVLNRVITIFAAPQIDMSSLALWLGAFFSSRLISAVISAHASLRMEQISLRLQAALKALLFRKSMRCSIQSKRGSRTVDISNLFTSDIHQVVSAVHLITTFWTIPLQIGAIVYMLHALIGVAAFAGMAVVAISLLVNFGLAPYSGRAYEDATVYMDDRMKTVKEVFNAIQIVKLNAWEDKFANVSRKQRSAELSALKRVIFIGALEELLVSATPVAVSIVSFAVYSLVLGQVLTSATVFTILALFDKLQGPLQALPAIIQSAIQVKVSIDRFSEYLSLEEFEDPMSLGTTQNSRMMWLSHLKTGLLAGLRTPFY